MKSQRIKELFKAIDNSELSQDDKDYEKANLSKELGLTKVDYPRPMSERLRQYIENLTMADNEDIDCSPKTPSELKAWLANDDVPIDWAERRRKRLEEPEDESRKSFALDGPPLFEIKSQEWWFKVVGMLCHNWALIEEVGHGSVTVFFFHDDGQTKHAIFPGYKIYQLSGRSAIIDSLNFDSLNSAKNGLLRNDFEILEETPGPWDNHVPPSNFYDARASESGIYSNGDYWR